MLSGMATATYPIGYNGKVDTLANIDAQYLDGKYLPEHRRRAMAAMEASRGLLGLDPDHGLCGGGGFSRSREQQAANYQRDPNTFAPPGASFHERRTEWADGSFGANAIDWVGRNGRHTEAWQWLRDFGGLYGIKTFHDVNSEPWHGQCIGIPNSVSQWRALGYPTPAVWTFPDGTPAPPTSPTDGDYGLWPYNKNKATIREGSIGDAVRYLQRVLVEKAGQNIAVDGEFGPATRAALISLQLFLNNLPADGIADRDTWDLVDAVAGYVDVGPNPGPPPPPAGTVQDVTDGLYWVRPGDSPWATSERIYGDARPHLDDFNPPTPASPGYDAPNHIITVPGLSGRTTTVQPDEGGYAIIGRMFPQANRYELLDRFHVFNGSDKRVLHPGDVVYLDTP